MDNVEIIREVLEDNDFSLYAEDDYVEIETWTDGGVNMIHGFNSEYFLEEFTDFVECFDVDDEVDFHREMDDYRNDFTIEESLEDFRAYNDRLRDVLAELNSRL